MRQWITGKDVRRRSIWLFTIVALILLFSYSARAQENAELTGTVTDPSGAVVPNASVTVTSTHTGLTRTANTNAAGLYDFPGLQIGTYDLKVSAPGFKVYQKTGIVMNVAATVQSNVTLAIGASTQTVTVAAYALALQTETNQVSNLISGQQISDIATNGRNITSLTTLGTGVSANLPSFNGVTAQGSSSDISFNGMRESHNDFLVDGGEIYDRGSGGKLGVMPSPDAIAEFQTLDSNYAPDYGISSGGTTTIVLKSGSNTYHGGAWEVNRNDDFDADNYFSKLSNTPTPELRLNIFGYNLGGKAFIPRLYPKDKSKTYFFYNEEWRRYIQGATPSFANAIPQNDFPTAGSALTYQVPKGWSETPAAGVCNTGQTAPCVPGLAPNSLDPALVAKEKADGLTPGNSFPGGVIPANLIDPNAALFLGTGAFPYSNTTSASGAPQYTSSPKQPTYVREEVVRIDQDFGSKFHLMGSWIHDQMSQTILPTQWSNSSYPTTGNIFANPSWGAVIKLTETITPTLLNEVALDVNGNYIKWSPVGVYAQPSGWTQTGYFAAANNAFSRMPSVDMGGPVNANWTISYVPWANAFLDYEPRDDLSWTKGKHSFKFGFSYMRNDKNQQQQADTQGDYSFGTDFSGDSYINFLMGLSDSFSQLQNIEMFHWINNTYSFYGMDNWHLTPRLTLNLGLRYDGIPHVYNKENMAGNFVPADFSTANEQVPSASTGQLNPSGPGFANPTKAAAPFYLDGIEIAGVNGFPRGLVKEDYFTWEPRLGFALDLFGNGKTVLRGGAGIFYERVQGNDVYGTDTNPPFAYKPTADDVYFTNPSTSAISGATASTPVFPASIGTLDYYYPPEGTMQFSLGVQHQFAPAFVGVVQYVGSGGWNQDDERAINTLPLGDLTDRQAVAGGANANLYRNYPGWSGIEEDDNSSNSNYNSLQTSLRMENKHGLTLNMGYTWSHEIDIEGDDLTGTSDPYNLRYDRGSGTYDRRNIFTTNYIYNVPFFKHSNSFMEHSLLGGWVISGVTTAESGIPQAVTYGGADTIGLGGGTTNRPNLTGAVSRPKTRAEWFNTSVWSDPVAPWAGGTNQGFGDAGKDAVYLPGLENTNLSLFKTFALNRSESTNFQFRVESFNTFNHTEWNAVSTSFPSGNFGEVTSTFDPRVLQFGAKFEF